MFSLLPENEIDGEYHEESGYEVIPMEGGVESYYREDDEDG